MNREIFIFEVAGRSFSVPLDHVEEVVPRSTITEIPNSPPFLLGLAAIRGKVMGVIDAAKRYGIGPADGSHFMVCRVRGNLTAVAIDRPVVAGNVPIREMPGDEYAQMKVNYKVDEKFLKGAYVLQEVLQEGQAPVDSSVIFLEVDTDLFVSAEMASKVGEV